MTDDAAARTAIATAATLLDRGRGIDRLSRALTVTALAGLAALAVLSTAKPVLAWALALAVLAGAAELYFGFRTGFDAALLHRLAEEAKKGSADLAALDAALARLGLMPPGKQGRPLEPRLAGALRLLRRQIAAALLQMLLMLFGGLAAALL